MDRDTYERVDGCEPGRTGPATGETGVPREQRQPQRGGERDRPQPPEDEADDDRGRDHESAVVVLAAIALAAVERLIASQLLVVA